MVGGMEESWCVQTYLLEVGFISVGVELLLAGSNVSGIGGMFHWGEILNLGFCGLLEDFLGQTVHVGHLTRHHAEIGEVEEGIPSEGGIYLVGNRELRG